MSAFHRTHGIIELKGIVSKCLGDVGSMSGGSGGSITKELGTSHSNGKNHSRFRNTFRRKQSSTSWSHRCWHGIAKRVVQGQIEQRTLVCSIHSRIGQRPTNATQSGKFGVGPNNQIQCRIATGWEGRPNDGNGTSAGTVATGRCGRCSAVEDRLQLG